MKPLMEPKANFSLVERSSILFYFIPSYYSTLTPLFPLSLTFYAPTPSLPSLSTPPPSIYAPPPSLPPDSLSLLLPPLYVYVSLSQHRLSLSLQLPPLCVCLSPCSTLVRLRAALSLPPGVRFLSWTSSSSTSWAMARTVEGTSPGRSSPLVCSASSLATIAAVSPERS